MRNFAREYPQGIERAGRGCIISMRSIRKAWKMWDVDAKFEKEVSSSHKKARCRCNLHVRQAEKHLQVMKKASCRYSSCQKSICTSE